MIKKLLLAAIITVSVNMFGQTPMTPLSSSVTFGSDWTTTNITNDNALDFPWEITYGPDGDLWITERIGEKIVKVSTATATNTPSTLIDLSAKVETSKQGGLMGMAIHPALYADIGTTTNNYVFVSYTYNDGGNLKVRLVRLIYNNGTGLLTEDTSLGVNGAIVEGFPGSSDHNSGRLIFGPDEKLYYTIGDQGANQFDFACDPVLSQVLPTTTTDYDNYPGKTLRLNIDGTIPSDNPTLNGVKSHVYTYGHRNAQGIIFANDGTLYNSEHGAKVDDEINEVIAGKNYGWPEIAGYYDNLAYSYCNWSSLGGSCNAGDFSDHNCPAGVTPATEYDSYPTAGDVPSNFQPPIGTYGSTIASDPSGGWFTWPTVAPSSIDIHEVGSIPCWDRSLLVTSLKKGTIYRAKLNAGGDDVVDDFYEEFHSSNDRYRDIAISPDGLTIYAVTDNSGGTSGPSSSGGVSIENPGVIIKIEYVGLAVTDPVVAPILDDVVSYCPITLTAPTVLSNASDCQDIVATTTDPTTYSSGTNVVTWSFDHNGSIVTANQNVIINALQAPSNIVVAPSTTSAQVSWDEVDGTSFEIRYRVQGSSTWTTETTSSSNIALTGLTLSTTYEYQIRSDCGATQSAYTTIDTFTTVSVIYTTPTVTFYPDDFFINNIVLESVSSQILNHSSDLNDDVNGYSNHTTGVTVPDLNIGDDFDISITLTNTHAWNKTTGHSVWIDYNQNGDFESSEKVWGTTNGDDLFGHNVVATGSFTVSGSAIAGNTRMRVASRTYYTPNSPDAMGFDNNNGGEYEDYTVNLVSNTLSNTTDVISSFAIYPNPVQDELNISIPQDYNLDNLVVEFYDMQGRRVKNTAIISSKTTITNLNLLSKGVYFIRFKDSKGVLGSQKMIKR